MVKKKTNKKKYVTFSYYQSIFFGRPFGFRIPVSPSGKVELRTKYSTLTIRRVNAENRMAEAQEASRQRDVPREGARYCRARKIEPRQNLLTEEEALFREVFFG